jgi:hypothetical protein
MNTVVRLSPEALADRLDQPGWQLASQRIFVSTEYLALAPVEQPFAVDEAEVFTIASTRHQQVRLDLEDFTAYELEPGVIEVYGREADLVGAPIHPAMVRLEHPQLRTAPPADPSATAH